MSSSKSSEIVDKAFKKVERSYHSTPNGWRLATFDEAREGLEMIREQNILKKWDRVRLLDGWITGPGYNFQIGNDFKGCLGYMLLIQTQASGYAYDDVYISDSQKHVALLLCVDDWNYEVIYWLFNSWASIGRMGLEDVIQGRIPFSNPVKFKEMNGKVCSLARKLGDKGPVSEKANKRIFSGRFSVKDVLSDMIEIVNEENLQQYSLADFLNISSYELFFESCFPRSLELEWLKDFSKKGGTDWNNIADAVWNFLSESFAESMVNWFSRSILIHICKRNDEYDWETISSSQKNFILASSILSNLSAYKTQIIHAPLAHNCGYSCTAKMMKHVASNCGQADLPRFNQTLQINAMWRCSDQIGNYDLLNRLLIAVAGGHVPCQLKIKAETDILVLKSLLDCGAHVGPAYSIGGKNMTALEHAVMHIKNDDIKKEVIEILLEECSGKKQLVNTSNKDESGETPLHFASRQGHAHTCQLLLKYGAELDVPDNKGKTALHIVFEEDEEGQEDDDEDEDEDADAVQRRKDAVQRGKEAVVNLFMNHKQIIELAGFQDNMGKSPLDRAVDKKDFKFVAKLISKSKQPEAYFDKVDLKQLLRYSLLEGSLHIVKNLFEKGITLPAGECDDEGKTALHLAAMCEDDNNAMAMVDMLLKNIKGKEKLVTNRDKRKRTVLHEAALNGNEELCRYLLDINPKIINLKDRDGRNPIYDAVNGKQNEETVTEMLLAVYFKKNISLNALIDRNGLTPLHVSVSQGKKELVKLLLSSAKNREEYSKGRDLVAQEAREYLKRSDFLGQTALHKAANCGDSDTVEILLNEGAHPLQERDCDGRTALHYAVKAKTGGDKRELVNSLLEGCKTNEEKWLLLWASAAGLGTADKGLSNDDLLYKFFVGKRNEIKANLTTGNLLKTASSVGDIEMTKELIARGYQIADIRDREWRQKLTPERKKNVKRVSSQLERIAEQANDQPTVLDNLGRTDYAHGLAALLLNPYIKPPIVVGISGTWGMGKSSLMIQTEGILLKTAAQMALLPSAKLSSSASELPEITTSELSKRGKQKYEEIKRHVDFERNGNRTLFSIMVYKIWSWVQKSSKKESRAQNGHTEQDSLAEFLNSYQAKYHKLFKSLAAMDSSGMFTTRSREDREPQNPHSKSVWEMVRDMFTTNFQRSKSSPQQSTAGSSVEESVPAVLTVKYNAWKYRNETEALAGMAVEITKELEGIMSEAQWLSTCWRNTWKKKKYNIWIEIIYPCLLAVVLACTITWILWVILDKSDKFKDWAIPKYACLPTGIVIIGWTVTKSVMGILKPVSTQLMSYISFPDHTDKLGYQERVISDITFLKDEIGKRPCMVFKAYSWLFTVVSLLWLLFLECWVTLLFLHPRFLGKTVLIPRIAPASGINLRIIVFIDDLDRCQESVILQVLSAINLVLAVCEINVVLGIDKGLIERAINKKYGDMKSNRSFKDNQELADKYLQKIIQLPLDLPDPSEEQSRTFLEGQLGVFKEPSEGADSESKQDAGIAKISRQKTLMPDARRSTLWDVPERETGSEINSDPRFVIDMQQQTETMVARYSTGPIFPFFERFCKFFLSSTSAFCGRKDKTEATTSDAAATPSAQTGREARQGEDETEATSNDAASSSFGEVPGAKHPANKISNRDYWSWIPITELLFIRYSKGEEDAFCYFQKLATDTRKLPREWKRHLTYHRLVWYIFYLTREAKDLAGWQVQLITWIFVCWEWRENMDFVIQNWKKIGTLKSSASNGPSLQMIVDHFAELESKANLKMTGTSHAEDDAKETILEVSVPKEKNIETECSKREQKPEKADIDNIAIKDVRETGLEGNDDQERNKRAGPEKLDTAVNKQLDTLEQTLRNEMDELKKQIKELKEEVMKQQSKKNEKRQEEKRMKLKRWETLRSALDKYDVSMDAIQAFQRFRFYCISGHLSWPLPE